MAIWLTQCLCERRHCIVAGAFDDAAVPVARGARETEEMLTQMAQLGNPWCSVCRSTRFHYETGRTPFASLDEVQPVLMVQALTPGDLLERIIAAHRRSLH